MCAMREAGPGARMQQCAEGWHRTEEVPDPDPRDDLEDEDLDPEGPDGGDEAEGSSRRVRSTKRRQDATDLPVKPVDKRTVGTTFAGRDGQVFRPSMFVTLTLGSYGKVVKGVGVPVDPDSYDYRRAALDAMHFAKLFDRWVQNLRRGAGFSVQYFSAVEPQRQLSPHLHAALRGHVERAVIKAVTQGTDFQLWWPRFDVPLYVHRAPVWDGMD